MNENKTTNRPLETSDNVAFGNVLCSETVFFYQGHLIIRQIFYSGQKTGGLPKEALLVTTMGSYLSLGSLGDRVGEAVVLPALAGVLRLRSGELLALPGAVRSVRRLRVVRLTR